MSALRSSMTSVSEFLASENIKRFSVLILILGLAFFIYWLVDYAWTIISTPFPAEYREGAILLMTDFLIHGKDPFTLANHPLMTNNYGFLYNLVVLPFALLFGNTLAVHRAISILFILASCVLMVWVLVKCDIALPFAIAGGIIVMASLMYSSIPLSRPDALGEFFFLLAILFPWYRKFDVFSLIISGLAGIFAFLAKPYFLLSIGVVATYVFMFVSKKKGLLYAATVGIALLLFLYVINIVLECYVLDVILNNAGNSSLTTSHMVEQSIRFIKIFLPSFLIVLLAFFPAHSKTSHPFRDLTGFLRQQNWLLFRMDQPLLCFSMDYFGFFLFCSSAIVVFWLGKHSGSYMSYYFELITPALVLLMFQWKDVLRNHTVVTVPLILINLSLICFGVLYPNRLSLLQEMEWKKLYQYLGNSSQVLNSPVLVPEMIRLGMMPVDSGQSEYFFNTLPYGINPFAPDYETVRLQGISYQRLIRTKVLNQKYDHIMITLDQGFSPFVGHTLIDTYYERVDLIHVAMPQTNQYWTIEISEPRK